jgi:Mlc titration factor MtfA (ptsG expression regulator)
LLTPENVVFLEIGFFAVVFLYLFGLVYAAWKRRQKLSASYLPKLNEVLVDYLKDFQYFRTLTIEGQVEFVKRLRYLVKSKSFIGMDGLAVTRNMRIKLSATIVQLTYGLKSYDIPAYDEIMVYPDTFFHPILKVKMKGFTSVRGNLAVSWPDYQKGYDVPDDNYNLGLHELAHALHINTAKTHGNQHFKRHFKYWTEKSLTDFYDLKNNKNQFLREYGGTNFHEFFAVVIEHLFESPARFLEEIPHLYIRTCELLNQNPLNSKKDYAFDWSDFLQYLGKNQTTNQRPQ